MYITVCFPYFLKGYRNVSDKFLVPVFILFVVLHTGYDRMQLSLLWVVLCVS